MLVKSATAIALALVLSACAVPISARGTGPYRYPDSRSQRYDRYAFDSGYRDGYNEGRDDARDRDRYDPHGSRLYRQADRGYEHRMGSRNAFRDQYRDGFLSGYEAGYRDARGRGRGRDRDRDDRRRRGW